MPSIIPGLTEGSGDLKRRIQSGITVEEESVKYYVLGDTNNDSRDDILDTPGLPQTYDQLGNMRVVAVEPKELQIVVHPTTGQQTQLYEVTVQYSSAQENPDEGGGGGGGSSSPLDFTPVYNWGVEYMTLVVTKNAEGNAMTNANLEPVYLQERFAIPVLNVSRYEAYPFDSERIAAYANTVNSEPFQPGGVGKTWGVEQAMMDDITSVRETIGGVYFARVNYKIMFAVNLPNRADDWDQVVLHEGQTIRATFDGKSYTDDDTAEPIAYVDPSTGAKIKTLLAIDGTRLPDGGTPVYQSFPTKVDADWGPLQL